MLENNAEKVCKNIVGNRSLRVQRGHINATHTQKNAYKCH